MLLPLIDAIYWLSLATWFGCVLSCAVVPPIVLRVIRESDPTLPRVLSVNLDKQHSTLLAGDVVGAILSTLFRLQGVCCVAFLPVLIVKWFTIDLGGQRVAMPVLLSALYVLASLFMFYGWRIVWPKVLQHRQTYLDNADNPDVANAELDQFDRYSSELFSIVRNLLFALIGMLIFSAALRPVAVSLVSN
jgi:hypothetical protein